MSNLIDIGKKLLQQGDTCTLNGHGDLAMDGDAKSFIGRECEYIKHTKANLHQVRLCQTKLTISVPLKNIEQYRIDVQGIGMEALKKYHSETGRPFKEGWFRNESWWFKGDKPDE